jgi:hypothetical protein
MVYLQFTLPQMDLLALQALLPHAQNLLPLTLPNPRVVHLEAVDGVLTTATRATFRVRISLAWVEDLNNLGTTKGTQVRITCEDHLAAAW